MCYETIEVTSNTSSTAVVGSGVLLLGGVTTNSLDTTSADTFPVFTLPNTSNTTMRFTGLH